MLTLVDRIVIKIAKGAGSEKECIRRLTSTYLAQTEKDEKASLKEAKLRIMNALWATIVNIEEERRADERRR